MASEGTKIEWFKGIVGGKYWKFYIGKTDYGCSWSVILFGISVFSVKRKGINGK